MNFDISVVIPCRTNDSLVTNTLKSLESQINCNFEVLLVINPSSKKTIQHNSTYALTILNSPKGANHARNEGLRHAQSDLVMFLDSDCLIDDPDLLYKYTQHMKACPELSGCGGPYHINQSASIASQVYQNIQTNWLHAGLADSRLITQHLLGGNLVLRKSKLNSSEFDEKIIFGGTELEFLLRLTDQGHLFQLLEQQQVIHSTDLSTFNLCKKAYKQGQGQLYTRNKLNLSSRQPKSLYIPQAQDPISKLIAFRCYYLFFQLGNQTWLTHQLKSLYKRLVSLYHRTYFYLTLVKRVK